MLYNIDTLLEAVDIADIYKLTPDELLITLTLATSTDNALKQELIKLDAISMQELQDEVNKWETRMNTVSRMLSEKQQRVQQTKTRNTGRGDRPMMSYRCVGPHTQNFCKVKKDGVTCAICNR